MKFKFNALVAALALIASAGAHAGVQTAATPGNSSAVFVAWSQAAGVSLTVDLGVNFTDFLQPNAAFTGAATPVGSLAYTTTPLKATWDLTANTRKVNDASVAGDYSWSTALADFKGALNGNSYTWGVIAADNYSPTSGGTVISASNVLVNRNVLATFNNLTPAKIAGLTAAGSTSTAANNINGFLLASTSGTLSSAANGAGTATAGAGYVGTTLKETLGAYSGWNYMNAVGASAPVFMVSQVSNPVVYQIGTTYGVDSLLPTADAANFSFDGNALSYQVAAVPEAGTLAMMLAGLGAVGFVARRRKAA